MSRQLFRAALAALALHAAPVALAQAPRGPAVPPGAAVGSPVIVHLRDGGEYRGALLADLPGVAIVIQTATGAGRRFELADIERVELLGAVAAPVVAPGAAPTTAQVPEPAPEPPPTPTPAPPPAPPRTSRPSQPPPAPRTAPPPANGPKGEWSWDADKTGAAIGYDKDLESDKVRLAWAEKGGALTAYEFTFGGSFLYMHVKFPDISVGSGMSFVYTTGGMNTLGGGVQVSGRIHQLHLTPPDYQKRETSWHAFKFGGGADLAVFATNTSTLLFTSTAFDTTWSESSVTGSMVQATLLANLGYMLAFGSFDSETEWSGLAIGLDWAPSFTVAASSSSGGSSDTSTSFNLAGVALNFESGSMEAMAATMAKKAHLKARVFVLPPIKKDFPLFVAASVGWVWY